MVVGGGVMAAVAVVHDVVDLVIGIFTTWSWEVRGVALIRFALVLFSVL